MKQKIIHTIAILGLALGIMSGSAYAVTNKISVNYSAGSVIFGPNSNTCNSGLTGAIRYTSGTPGTLAWCDGVTPGWVTLGGGGASAGGANTNIQFNSGGSALGGVAGYTYDPTNNIMAIATASTGSVRTGNGTVSLPSHAFTAGASTGMWQSSANAALDFAVGGVNVLQLGTTVSAINWIALMPDVSANAPTMLADGKDYVQFGLFGASDLGTALKITGKNATATGAGGPITITGGAGNGSGAGGAINYAPGSASFWSNGGSIGIGAGDGGSTSGNGGNLTFTAGTAISGTAGNITAQVGGTTYMTIQTPGTANSSVVFNRRDALVFPNGLTSQRPTTGVNGMIRYNTSSSKMETYQAGAWVNIMGALQSMDDFSDAITNYSPTTGASGNSLYSMFVGAGGGAVTTAGAQYNTGMSAFSFQKLTTGQENTAFGFPSMNNLTTGSYNTAFGAYTMGREDNTVSTTNGENTVFGDDTGYSMTAGFRNTLVGANTAMWLTTGSDNTTMGGFTDGSGLTTGIQNTSLGDDSFAMANTSYSTAIGSNAGQYDTGVYNVFIGPNARNQNSATTGYNTGFGGNALSQSSGNTANTAMGINAGQYLTTGSNNTYFGQNSGFFGGRTTTSGSAFLGASSNIGSGVVTNTVNIQDVMFASSGGSNYVRIDANQHMNYKGTVPVISSCGTGPSIVGNDNSFRVTSGTGTPNTCAITFANSWATAPICNVSTNLAETLYISTVSTTAITVTAGGSTNGRILAFECRGYY